MKPHRCHDNFDEYLDAVKLNIKDGIYHAIKRLNLPYVPATFERITQVTHHEGPIIMEYWLDDKVRMVSVVYLSGQKWISSEKDYLEGHRVEVKVIGANSNHTAGTTKLVLNGTETE